MMERRNRSIILFFEENEDDKVINSRLVRLYMNRFTIEEEQRYDIAGIYNLTPVPLITRIHGESEKDKKQKKLCIAKKNWIKDQFIIRDAIEKIQLYAQFNIDVHIFMGTALYVEGYIGNYPLKQLIQNWRKTIWTQTSIPILLTLLNGRNDSFATTVQVKETYRTDPFPFDNSVNNDLEIFFKNVFYDPVRPIQRKLVFLYEMLSEAELRSLRKTNISFNKELNIPYKVLMYANNDLCIMYDECTFAKFECSRLTVYLE